VGAEVAGRRDAGQRQLVIFRLANETYGVDIHQVREIIRVPEITRVPRTPDYVEGIINLRGGVIPVLDLRKRFGLAAAEDESDRRIIVVELEDTTLGMIVDGVSEVLRIDESEIEEPSPYIMSIDSDYIAGTVKRGDKLMILLTLERVVAAGDRERIASLEGESDGGV